MGLGGRRLLGGECRLEELQSVAERIEDINALITRQGLIVRDLIVGLTGAAGQGGDVVDTEGDMRLAGGAERLLDAAMQLDAGAFEPGAPASGQVRRLGRLGKAQQPAVEGARRRLSRLSGWRLARGLWPGSPNAPFQGNSHQLLSFDGEFHGQFLQHVLDEAVDQQLDRLLLGEASLHGVEQLVIG